MFKSYLKIMSRNAIRQKGYSFINIIGLAIGIACCILILLYVNDELSYDRYHENAERIHRVAVKGALGNNQFDLAVSCAPMAKTLVAEFPEVVNATRLNYGGFPVLRYKDKAFSEERFFAVDSTFFDVFTAHFLQGNPETALTKPNTLVLTESMAKKYFGDENPIGKLINSDGRSDYLVTGVVKDVPENSHFYYDFLGSLSTYGRFANDEQWISNNFYTYILLHKDASPETVNAKFPALVQKYAAPQIEMATGASYQDLEKQGAYYGFFLQPLVDIHLNSDLDYEITANGNMAYVYIFSLVAIAILLIACINFMNLATARSAERAKEVGIRKTLGSNRSQLIRQFLAETIFMTAIAVLLALVLVKLLLPFFNLLAGKTLAISLLDNGWVIPGLFAFTFILGGLAGIYPAFFLASFQIVNVLKGNRAASGKSASANLRGGLVIFQFAISIFLFIGAFIVHQQLDFIRNKKLGFNQEQILVVKKTDDLSTNIHSFIETLRNHSDVLEASNSNTLPGLNLNSNVHKAAQAPANENHILWDMRTDDEFVAAYEIEMIYGRSLSYDRSTDTTAVMINETAAELFFGLKDAVGEELIEMGPTPETSRTYLVAGVMKDFHFESLHQRIRPMAIKLFRDNGFGRNVSVRIAPGKIPETIAFVKKTWQEFAKGQAFEYAFFDDDFAQLYEAERRTGNLMTIFSGLAILVACLGLFGLAAFAAEQRTKEIGIRKTLGASVPNIVRLLFSEFAKWVLLANIFAWPAAWFFMQDWLQNFSYRVDIGVSTFILSALLALVIAFVTVSYQTIKAAMTNPVDALRYE